MSSPAPKCISRISPVYYYNLSKPLVPAYGTNVGAMLVLLGISIVLSGAAIWLFAGRDVGAPVALPGWLRVPERAVSPERALPVNAWSLRSIYTRSVAKLIPIPRSGGRSPSPDLRPLWCSSSSKRSKNSNPSSPVHQFLKNVIQDVGGTSVRTNDALLSFLFEFLPVLLMAFAVTQASRWAADEEDGLHELVLATPQPRLTVILARFGALTTATVFISVVTLAATALASAATGLTLDGGNLTAASLSLIPMGLLIAALGYLFAGWLRTAIDTGLLSFLLVIWFFISFVGPELNLPDGVKYVSAIYYYGTPLVSGLPLGDMLGVLAVVIVALVLASVRFVRKDIGR